MWDSGILDHGYCHGSGDRDYPVSDEYYAVCALDILVIVLDFSIGNALAWVVDKTDASGLNGMIQYGFSGGHLGGGGSF